MYTRTQQQDAQEFLIFLVNHLSELIKKETGEPPDPPRKDTESETKPELKQTWVEKLFEGRLRTETRCLCCETVQTRDEPFINLSVPISQNTSITGCLRDFSAGEYLKGDNKYYCDTCCSYQEADKGLKVHVQPQVLIVQLKRFEYHERHQCLTKLSARVPFPLELKLFNTVRPTRPPATAACVLCTVAAVLPTLRLISVLWKHCRHPRLKIRCTTSRQWWRI
jgi:ubiquitin carboxyl-terminal hydrolase 12/46